MTLQLDARQLAMLAEMNIRVFLPLPPPPMEMPQPVTARLAPDAAAPPPAPAPAAASRTAAAPAGAVPTVARQSASAPPAPTEIDGLDWDALAAAAAELAGPARMVFGAGDRRADWLLVGEPLTEEEEQAGTPFAGQAGKLLDNMLLALGLNRRQGAYLTNVVKVRPGLQGLQPQELAAWEAILRRQVALLKPRVILAMGRFPLQVLLRSGEPLGRLRGRAHDYQGVPVVVTYPPGYLLRTQPDKARAWADLCLARALLG